jgi:hypothetical protein
MSRLRRSLAVVLVLACTEPSPAITGQFGGRLMELSATGSGAEFQLACGNIVTPPLRMDSDDVARVQGTFQSSSAGFGTATVDVAVKHVSALTLVVTVTFPSGSSQVVQLHRNAPPDFSDVICLAS